MQLPVILRFMLEQLFGSRTRVKLLRLFLTQPNQRWFVRELTRTISEQINSVRRELLHLEKIGLLQSKIENHRKYYSVNPAFQLYPELKALFVKARFIVEKRLLERLSKQGNLQYFSLLGYFVDDPASAIDVFIVGDIDKLTVQRLLNEFKEQFGQELRYTVISSAEYRYRKEVTDKFLFTILQSQQIVLVDRRH